MNGLFILITILVYFGVLLTISKLTSGKHTDNDAFFRGNRQSPWYIVSFGMIGASLSGVTFVSVPGMVRYIDMTYMQTCIGFFFGYIVIALVLLPLYYRLNLTSIYSYLGQRFGRHSYKTGASFFLLSKMLGAAARLYLVCLILQHYVFAAYGVPFAATAIGTVILIWLYTRRSGIRTIVWTDSLQTFCLLAALALIIYNVMNILDLNLSQTIDTIRNSEHSRIFVFDDWQSKQNFFKQFFSGIFITIVMTGLDQDMMQKNLSCRNLHEAQKNMYCYGISFVPVNLLFLSLGILLLIAAPQLGIELPAKGDDILPLFAAEGYLGPTVLVLFTIGIIAAAFSSADSALAALTTSFCIDILGTEKQTEQKAAATRRKVHLLICTAFVACILAFEAIGSQANLTGNRVGGSRSSLRIGGGGTNQEAILAVGEGGLDNRIGLARVAERSAHVVESQAAGVVERNGRAADELDAELQAAHANHNERQHDEHGRNGKQDLPVAQEIDVMLDETALHVANALEQRRGSVATALLHHALGLVAVKSLADLGLAGADAFDGGKVGVNLCGNLAVLDIPERRMRGDGARRKQANKRSLEQQHHDDVAHDAQGKGKTEALNGSGCEEEQAQGAYQSDEVGVDGRLNGMPDARDGGSANAAAHTDFLTEALDRKNRRVGGHADRQNNTGNARKRKAEQAEVRKQG